MAGNEIVIDLSKQGDAQSYDVGSLIQQEAREKFKNLAESFIASIDSKKSRSCFGQLDRVHNTILINGKRGMGKTTFMLSILNELCGKPNKEDECEQYKKCKEKDENNTSKETNRPIDMDSLRRDICVLEILDPTLIETKEHVLLNIITKIKTKVEKHRECRPECKERDGDYQEWMKSLKKLAGGVNLLDGVGRDAPLKDNMYEDSALVLEQGLSDSKQGSKLEEHLHGFIKKSLDMLGKKAFLLVFDDIDTSLKEGRDILETLRKYLTSRQLITVMLGDIDLYSTLVRQLQWEKIDPNKTLKEYENIEDYKEKIEHLEEQYLVKILKPENRIDLKSIFQLKNKIVILNTSDKSGLTVVIKHLVEKLFFINGDNAEYSLYETLILSQPTRSVLQLIKGWDKVQSDGFYFGFIDTMKHTFFTSVKSLSSAELLYIENLDKYMSYLSMYILNSKDIERDNHLKFIPEFKDNDKNLQIFYLNALTNYIFSNEKANYLSYFVKLGYALEAYSRLEDANSKELNRFINHIALDSIESSSKTAKRILATFKIDGNTRNKPVFFGNCFVKKEDVSQLFGSSCDMIISKTTSNKFGDYNFISFFNLLGLIADLAGKDIKAIERILTEKSQIVEFQLFKDSGFDVDDSSEATLKKNSFFSADTNLIESVANWATKINSVENTPMFVLAKIWVRIVYAFGAIENKNKDKTYADVFHMFIVTFLNALFIEISLHKGNQPKNVNNTITDSSIYEANIKDYAADEKYSLYDFISECPLWGLYINPTEFKELRIKQSDGNSFGQLKLISITQVKQDLMDFAKDIQETERNTLIADAIINIKNEGQEEHKEILNKPYANWDMAEFVKIYEAIKYRIEKQKYKNVKRNFVKVYLAKK